MFLRNFTLVIKILNKEKEMSSQLILTWQGKIKKLGYSILKDNLLPALVPAFHIYFSTAVLQMTCRNSTVRTHCDDFNSSCVMSMLQTSAITLKLQSFPWPLNKGQVKRKWLGKGCSGYVFGPFDCTQLHTLWADCKRIHRWSPSNMGELNDGRAANQ